MSRDVVSVRENMIHFLIREAAAYLYAHANGRITFGDIATLLTTEMFSVTEDTVRSYVKKYPSLREEYSLFGTSLDERFELYATAIRELWKALKRKPTFSEIAKKSGFTREGVYNRFSGQHKDTCPAWLLELLEHGPRPDESK